MRFEEFERRARSEWERIPEAYRAGVDGLVVEREAKLHPGSADTYTLGECLTDEYPSDFGGPDTIRSFVVLYYGSFFRLSLADSNFDWDAELWETLTHELQHHLESLADEDALIDFDRGMDEYFKRAGGEPYDPWFYRLGEPIGPDAYRLERSVFIERDQRGAGPIQFTLDGRTYAVARPRDPAEIEFVQITGGLAPEHALDELFIVLVRRLPLRRRLRLMFRGGQPTVGESEARAEPVAGARP